MRQKVSVPNLTGMSLSDARNSLLSMKLSVGTITSSDGTAADAPNAVVVSQDPAGGEQTNFNVVNLTIGSKSKSQKKTGQSILQFQKKAMHVR